MPKLLFFILIITSATLHSQAQSFEEKDFTRYSKLDGLSHNSITGIVQDSTGYIWIATNKGLNRFDGKTFINYFKNSENSPLPDNSVTSLRLQNNYEIIGCTINGAFWLNARTGSHQQLIIPSDSIAYFFANRVVDALKDKKGNYVVSTRTGLYVFDPPGKIIFRYDHYSTTDAGRIELWFGNWLKYLDDNSIFQQNGLSGSLYHPEKKSIDTFFTLKKLKELGHISPLKAGDTSSSFNGMNGHVFFVNPDESTIEIIDLKNNSVSSVVFSPHIISDLNWYSRSFHINDSLLAVTSKIGGFYIFKYNAKKNLITVEGKKYFASKYCSSIFKDRDGRLWIGTNDGLYRQNLRNAFFTTVDLSQQLHDIVNTGIQSIYADKEILFTGLRNEGGLLLLDKKTKRINRHINFERLGKGSNTIIYILSYHPDTLWLGTGNGIIWLSIKKFSFGKLTHISGAPAWMYNDRCRNYLQDSRGNIWFSFGQLNSIVTFNRNEYKFTEITGPLLRLTFCFSLAEDKQGNIWLAGGGFCRWNVKKQAIDTLIPYPPVRTSKYNFVEILDVDEKNNLWLSSGESEIIQYDCSRNRMWLRLPENNSADGNLISNSPVINGHIWMCLSNGISAFNIMNNTVKQFNYADGLPNAVATSVRKGSFYDKSENLFYFGAGHYLISFIPNVSLPQTQAIPKFFIEVIPGNGEMITETIESIRLSSAQNNLQLRFNVINFTDPEDNRYSYRIKSKTDSSWHDLNTQTTIGLNNLAPGSYEIEAKLSSVNNRWPEQIKNISIVIVPPFWKTKWFILTGVVLLSLLLYLFYRFRIRQVRQKANLDKLIAQTEMKALHAQMNPHFIFNCLNSIREMILHNENQQASHYLSKFAQLIRITLNQSSKQFITLENTIDYLERYIEMEKIRNNKFTYTIETDDQLQTEDIMIPPMLIQPFVENAIWHGTVPGKELQIILRFIKEDNRLVCYVDDNGPGIEGTVNGKKDINHNSIGIDNVRGRIQVLNEKYKLNSELSIADKSKTGNETGTIVKLYFPLKSIVS